MQIIQFNGYTLRELRVSDSAAIFPTLSDMENHKFTTFDPHENEEQTARWIERQNLFWAIALPDDTAVGFVGYHSIDTEHKICMISIHLNKAFWGKGIAPAAVSIADNYIFSNTGIEQIAATVKPENTQSQRCLLKAGYTLEKVIENYVSSAVNDHSRVRHYYAKRKSISEDV
ncbi:MAG: GNAT family N-acetyltransferase [Oscillospiraceae bacterium]|nr:GNAT family N-acetyltransferase [Oscillospiraceae bacterium]